MRITEQQGQAIRQAVADVTEGKCAAVRIFGSRLDDQAKGGDLDLLLEFTEPVNEPALLAATVGARISLMLQGRKVDVLLCAPNLKQFPIHEIALAEGQLL